MTVRDPVAVNPRPAGSPVLRSRLADARLPLRPCGTGGIYRPYGSSPPGAARRARRAENPPPASPPGSSGLTSPPRRSPHTPALNGANQHRFSERNNSHGTRTRHHPRSGLLRQLPQRCLAPPRPIRRAHHDRPRGPAGRPPGRLERPQNAAAGPPGTRHRRHRRHHPSTPGRAGLLRHRAHQPHQRPARCPRRRRQQVRTRPKRGLLRPARRPRGSKRRSALRDRRRPTRRARNIRHDEAPQCHGLRRPRWF